MFLFDRNGYWTLANLLFHTDREFSLISVDRITLRSTKLAPIYPVTDMTSLAKKYPNIAANTGSKEKINPMRVGVEYLDAIVCRMNPIALHTIPSARMAIQLIAELGKAGVSNRNEQIKLNNAAKPNCNTPREIGSAFLEETPTTMIWKA